MGLTKVEVLAALADPETRYPSVGRYRELGRMVATKGRIAVVYDPGTQDVITIIWNTHERYDRQENA